MNQVTLKHMEHTHIDGEVSNSEVVELPGQQLLTTKRPLGNTIQNHESCSSRPRWNPSLE